MSRKCKILVLSDLKGLTPILLNNAIALSKIINGEVEFLHVKKPTELVKTASQLSAVREINEYTKVVKRRIKEILDPISKRYNTKVNYKYSFGNIKDEIEKFINKSNPDVIVLGKPRSGTLSFVGDNIIDFVLKSHRAAVLVVSHNSDLVPDSELSVGIFNEKEKNFTNGLVKDIVKFSTPPIRSFSIGTKSEKENRQDEFFSKKMIQYVFEESSDVISSIAGYIPKSKVNLICTKRNNYIKEVIKKIDVSIFVT